MKSYLYHLFCIVPLGIGLILLLKGVLQLLLIQGAGYDIRLLWTATQYFLRGTNPFDAAFYYSDLLQGIESTSIPPYFPDLGWPEQVNYPPTSILTQILFFALPLEITRYYFVIINIIGVLVMSVWASTKVEASRWEKIAVAGFAIANLGYSQTIINGNYGVIVVTALVSSFVLRHKHPFLAGLFMGIALVKPTVSAPFLFLFLREKNYKVLGTCATYLFASILLTVWLSKTDILTLLQQTIEGSSRFASGGYAIWKVLRALGFSQTVSLFLNVVIFLVPFLFVLWRTSPDKAFALPMLAFASGVARFFT